MMKKLYLTLSMGLFVSLYSQTVLPSGLSGLISENYVYSRQYLEATSSSSTTKKQIQSVTYFDGLGRPKQSVVIKQSPTGKDLVTTIPYDSFGRQVNSWLPAPMSSKNGGIQTGVEAAAITAYTDTNPFAHKVLENSPLDRINQQINPGTDWATKPVIFKYEANAASDVIKFTTTTIWIDGRTNSNLIKSGLYPKETLYKNSVKDEDENETIEFKNGEGQTLLVRKNDGVNSKIDTYYVYNEYNQLAFVISPLAVSHTISESILSDLCYQYRYDGRGRLVEKKLPGKEWEYMVYDQQDRLVLMQDGNLRTTTNTFNNKGWLFTKYDKFSRVVYTGFFQNPASRSSIQNTLNNNTSSNNEERVGTPSTNLQGLPLYYSKIGFPTTGMTLLSVNYYDAYPVGTPAFENISAQNGLLLLSSTTTSSVISTQSLPVAGYVKNIENDGWTKSYTFYDTKARPVGSYTYNSFGGFTKSESKLLFSGKPEYSVTTHSRASASVEKTIKETFEYDHQERLVNHYHKVDNRNQELLTHNTYDEIGRLQIKDVGNTLSSPLQNIQYEYNIRGWLTKINNPNMLGNKLFGYEIAYNKLNTIYHSGAEQKYNGNISQVAWATQSDALLRIYSYKYDKLNRLSNSWLWDTMNLNNGEYQENLGYDINGNIKTVFRTGEKQIGNTAANVIDNLIYINDNNNISNRLVKIIDSSENSSGYKYVAVPTNISYDINGNMTSMSDKGITHIAYNYLNLPTKITGTLGNTSYLYRADGTKVKKTYGTKTTAYLDGFQYEDNVLQFMPTAEGYYDFLKNTYIYNYNDHLGNVRLSYSKNPSTGALEIIEENNYYAFGLKHEGYNPSVPSTTYNYKYNGKELQETGMYDYGARMYMPDIGRWISVDPLAEKMPSWSPYSYSFNNPVRYVDPDGRSPLDWVQIGGSVFWDSRVTNQSQAQKYWGSSANYHAPNSFGSPATNGSGYVLFGENREWVQNATSHIAPDMAGTEPLSTRIGNYISDNIILEGSISGSLGFQVGGKAGVFEGSAGTMVTNTGAAQFNFINGEGSIEQSDGRFNHFVEGVVGIKGLKGLELGGGISSSTAHNENKTDLRDVALSDFRVDSKSFNFGKDLTPNPFGQKRGYGPLNVQPGIGGKSNERALNIGVGAKLLIGVDINLKVGVK